MLNLSFVFEDANDALREASSELAIKPLPAVIYLMQRDVINHYRHALDHYLPIALDAPFLQKSSLGTPYQKWAKFTNDDFDMLFFAFGNLLRYTSRLLHETLIGPGQWPPEQRWKGLSNVYTELIGDLSHKAEFVGIHVYENSCLRVFALVDGHLRQRGPTDGAIRCRQIDIRDRSTIGPLVDSGQEEVKALQALHDAFGLACTRYYEDHAVVEPFSNMHESYWT